ncbi:phosphoenolpyruvate--protein phosphotransferase [Desulfobacterales bacterium HSG16]|nr:phosphoenolpyruvate--protein phosphotransferase [Desulfobacterales bacterium HSG16]
MKTENDSRQTILEGIGASPGICIGKAYLVDKEGVDVIKKYYISDDQLDNEKNRFKSAVKKAKDELHQIIEDIPDDLRENADILETHVVLLKDKMLYGRAIKTIEQDRVNAEWALKKVVAGLKKKFNRLPDPFFRERVADIAHVSDRILRSLAGVDKVKIKDIDKRVILVAEDLSPAETSQIQLEKIKGIVTDAGGVASHTGIIARTLEIPALLGLENATSVIQGDDLIIVDGTEGKLILSPTEQTLLEYEERIHEYEIQKAFLNRESHVSAKTKDGVVIKVMGNIELPEEVVSVKTYGGDGIGLYRTEFQYLARNNFPSEFELFDKYRDVVEVMAPQPVTIRTLDINGDKAVSYTTSHDETNPALGLRAIRYCLKKPDIFKTQLKAILRAAAFGNVRILFPMISCYDEVIEAKRMLDVAAQALEDEDRPYRRDIEIGIMMEVPSAVIIADILAKEVDFFSIGTNDLIQYSLAIDRVNRQVAHLYNPLHPSIIRMVKRVSDVAKENNIKVFMCGEMAAHPIHVPILLGLSIDELSMNPQSIPAVKSMIRSLDTKSSASFIDEVMEQKTSEDVMELTQRKYAKILAENVYFH